MAENLTEKTTAILSTLPTTTSPETKVLIELIKLLLNEIKDLKELNSDVPALKGQIEVQKTVTNRLKKDNVRLHERIDELSALVDENEQHGRNVNLVLKGIPEEDHGQGTERRHENTTVKFVEALNAHFDGQNKLVEADIARSHRLGKRRGPNDKPRPIIARFASEIKKMNTYRAKRKLKGKGISLAENLTQYRADVYKEACTKLDYKNVWTWEGRIYATVNGKKIHIRDRSDIPGYVYVSDTEEDDE